jgi:hypothetical protein
MDLLHTLFFYIIPITLNTPVPVINNSVYLLLTSVWTHNSWHFFNSSVTLSLVLNLFPRMAYLRAPKLRKFEGAWSGIYPIVSNTHHHTMTFWWPPAHAWEHTLFHGMQQQEWHSQLTTKKKIADTSCWFWMKYRKCCITFWATLIQCYWFNQQMVSTWRKAVLLCMPRPEF